MLYVLLMAAVLVGHAMAELECEEGWLKYTPDGSCMKFFDLEKSFQDAMSHCEQLDAWLPRLPDDNINYFVYDALNLAYGEKIWMPIIDDDATGDFTYLNGDPLGDYNSNWKNREKYTDVGDNPTFTCVYRLYSITDYFWYNQECDNMFKFVCQKYPAAPPAECDHRWYPSTENDACIKVVKGRKKNFNGAKKYCEKLGGELATSVVSASQRSSVMDQIKFRGHVWIGVHSPGEDGQFEYIDGSSLDNAAPFRKGRPKNSNANHCVTMKSGKWYDKRCGRRFFFVCEKTPNNS